MTHLHLVPGQGDGPGEVEIPVPPEVDPVSEAEALEDRVMLSRLARNLEYVGSPGGWLDSLPEDALVAVFTPDAMPELASLMLRRPR